MYLDANVFARKCFELVVAFVAFAGDGPDVKGGGSHEGGNPRKTASVKGAAQYFFGEAATVCHEQVACAHVVAMAVKNVDGGDGAGG